MDAARAAAGARWWATVQRVETAGDRIAALLAHRAAAAEGWARRWPTLGALFVLVVLALAARAG